MYCDTGLAAPQDRVTSIETLKCTAARSRFALVAAIKPRIIKIAATRALKDVAAQCRHISQLRRSSGQKRLREQRIALSNQRLIGRVAVGCQRADPDAPAGQFMDLGQRSQLGNVDEAVG